MTLEIVKQYIMAISSLLSDNLIFSFINGIKVYIYYLSKKNQKNIYNSYYKQYTCRYLAIIFLNGLFNTIFINLPTANSNTIFYI